MCSRFLLNERMLRDDEQVSWLGTSGGAREALVTLSPLETNHKMSENSHASPRGQGQHLFCHYEV